MKIMLSLNTPDATDEVVDLKNYIAEQNLKGIQTTVPQKEAEEGTMSGADYLPIVQMILGSAATATVVKGLFDIVKGYFMLQKQKITTQAETEKAKTETGKIEMTFETPQGKKVDIKLNTFDEGERKHFYEAIDKLVMQ